MQGLPSLQQLRIFEAVATLESISAAAKTIHLSQPSVTLAIGQLESKVGARLLISTPNWLLCHSGRLDFLGSRSTNAHANQASAM